MSDSIRDRRVQYETDGLDVGDLDADPITQWQRWHDAALEAGVVEPNAMTLSTIGTDGIPDSRIVLVRGLDARGLVFYTNYDGAKSQQLNANPVASATFGWLDLHRQVRVRGPVERVSADESDTYFATRPTESQLNAWVSEQSRPLADMSMLELRRLEKAQELGLAGEHIDGDGIFECGQIPRPQFWGGYRFWFSAIEAWQEGKDRYHDRLRYERELTQDERSSFVTGPWTWQRLQP